LEIRKLAVVHVRMNEDIPMMAFLPLLFGQNPTPENHAKLHFTIGIPIGLRSAYSIKI
jgi:hypothetical protein